MCILVVNNNIQHLYESHRIEMNEAYRRHKDGFAKKIEAELNENRINFSKKIK